jgi:hypothetical protein
MLHYNNYSPLPTEAIMFQKQNSASVLYDIDIIGWTTRADRETFLKLEKTAQEIGLTVNESKTKYMEITCKPNNMQCLIVNNYKFKKVN